MLLTYTQLKRSLSVSENKERLSVSLVYAYSNHCKSSFLLEIWLWSESLFILIEASLYSIYSIKWKKNQALVQMQLIDQHEVIITSKDATWAFPCCLPPFPHHERKTRDRKRTCSDRVTSAERGWGGDSARESKEDKKKRISKICRSQISQKSITFFSTPLFTLLFLWSLHRQRFFWFWFWWQRPQKSFSQAYMNTFHTNVLHGLYFTFKRRKVRSRNDVNCSSTGCSTSSLRAT